MNRSKIEWCDHTFNIITGCQHGCGYCYARLHAKRFCGDVRQNMARSGEYKQIKLKNGTDGYILEEPMVNTSGNNIIYPFGFCPTLHMYRRNILDNLKRGNNVFVGAMADVFGEWVPDDWIREVMGACIEHPLNNYLFLTKNPRRYVDLIEKGMLPKEENFWYGSTITDEKMEFFVDSKVKTFVSIEPILKPFRPVVPEGMGDGLKHVDWIIIGAETGRRKGKVVPEFEWVKNIVLRADTAGVPVFMKDSLIPIVGEKNMRRNYPRELQKRKLSPKMEDKLYDICNQCGKKMKIREMVTLQARSLRETSSKTYGYMCWPCFEAHCKSLGVDVPDIPKPGTGKEKL